ncbi:MAG: transcriptional repressor [Candidatus Omnitrophica bacterium]|nr:transcriptional repressor [Candidatus Omnitrophota bacterium]
MASKVKSDSKWIYRHLQDRGCRITKPRQAILNILQETRKHLTAQTIYFAAQSIYPDVGLASIYRNLELFTDIGLVLKYDFGENQARYELAQGPQSVHHHHLICKNCNKIVDYSEAIDDEKEFLRRREKNLSRKYGFKIESHFIDFVGLCEKCSKRR